PMLTSLTIDCEEAYDNYVACVTNFNANYNYYQVTLSDSAEFYTRKLCGCVEGYCDVLNEILQQNLQFSSFSEFNAFTNIYNYCLECLEYNDYLDAVANYNSNTSTFQITTVLSPG